MSVRKASFALALLWATPAAAQDCHVRVNAMDITVNAAAFRGAESPSRTERLLAWPGRALNDWRGTLPACDSEVTLNFMAGIEGLPDSDGYCLAEGDAQTGLLLVPGARDYRGRCARDACERVNGAADDVMAATARLVALVYGEPEANGVAHPSGAIMVTAAKDYLADQLEAAGSVALTAAFATPTAATATALTVVTVGGSLWLCNS